MKASCRTTTTSKYATVDANKVAHVAEQSLRGFVTLAREGIAGLKPFANDVVRSYLDGAYIGEGTAGAEFSVRTSAAIGDHVLEAVRWTDETEKDRTQFRISVAHSGTYRYRFDQVRRIIGGLETSRLEMTESTSTCSSGPSRLPPPVRRNRRRRRRTNTKR